MDEMAGAHSPDKVRVLVPCLEEVDQRTGGGSIVGKHGPYSRVAHTRHATRGRTGPHGEQRWLRPKAKLFGSAEPGSSRVDVRGRADCQGRTAAPRMTPARASTAGSVRPPTCHPWTKSAGSASATAGR